MKTGKRRNPLPAAALVLALSGFMAFDCPAQVPFAGPPSMPLSATPSLPLSLPGSGLSTGASFTPPSVAQPVSLPPTIRPANLSGVVVAGAAGGTPTTASTPPAPAGPPAQRLTLEEAKERVLTNSKLLALASMNIRGKEFATRAVCADYFPQLVTNVSYFNFSDPLGQVLTLPGRTLGGASKQISGPGVQVQGPRGNTLLNVTPQAFNITTPSLGVPGRVVDVAVVNQSAYLGTVMVAQPITALLKIRQGVKIARADECIAQAQLEQGARALSLGVDQLYWGLVASHRLRAGVLVAIAGAEQAAKLGSVDARIALVEAKQGLQGIDSQIADLEQQLNALLDQPACTRLEVVEPPFPPPPVTCCEEAATLAVAASPEVREAEQNIVKAQAATAAAKVDYLPNVVVVGGYANQTIADYVQPNIGFVGVNASWTLWDWGKRKNVLHERENLIGMAALKVRQVEDEVREKALKACREFGETKAALVLAEEIAKLRKEALKEAKTPAAIFPAAKKSMEAEVDLVKADLAHRIAYVKLIALIGKPGSCP